MSLSTYTKQATEYYDPYKKKALESANKIYDEQEKVANDTYNTQIEDVKKSYFDVERENAVQKLINEREIEENMANMELSNSGLNRTQQTAVQLSYANNQNKINLQKQQQVDSLAQSLAAEISSIKQNRIAATSDIENQYSSLISEMATENYNNDLEAETARQKAYYSAMTSAAKAASQNDTFLYTFSGEDPNNPDNMIYYDSNGKKYSKKKGLNPYTGDNNTSLIKEFGAFSNGYQYKGVPGVGELVGSVGTTTMYGKNQKVWKTANNRTWVWNGKTNSYVEVEI